MDRLRNVSARCRGIRVALALFVWPGAVAMASEPSAKDFIAGIYALHIGPSEGFGLDTKADYFRFFEPRLAWLMYRDDRKTWLHNKQAAKLYNYDPFVDAKTWSFSSVAVEVTPAGPRRAVATATFDEAGAAKTIKYDLVHLRAGWRIRDIHAPSGDLRARFVVT
jgi:hypothetical protein